MFASRSRSSNLSLALTALTFLAAPSLVSAAPVDDVAAAPIASEVIDIGGWEVTDTFTGDDSDLSLSLTIEAQAQWSASITTGVSFESDDVRQGADLEVSRIAALSTGALNVVWSVTGTVETGWGTASIGPVPFSADNVGCAPALSGGAYDCVAESSSVEVVGLPPGFCEIIPVPPFVTPGIPLHPYVELRLRATFTITPEGIVTQRTLVVDDDDIVDDSLELTDSLESETLDMPCTSPADSEVFYELADYAWSPETTASQSPIIAAGIMDPIVGCVKIGLVEGALGTPYVTNPSFVLEGDGHTTDMGELLANDVAPTIAPMGPFAGLEGSPVTFGASVTSQCPIGSSLWLFSDGGTAFGPAPQHTFEDDALYSGQLTVIDITGLSAARNFSAAISNVLPTAYAGPNTSGLWGVPIAFNGQGVDPGGVDNATLVYSWNWGDGTPGTGGANASHVYGTPGSYVATLTVCDDHGCASNATNVEVHKRSTVTSYTGANVGVYSASAMLAGTVVDQLGNAISGASVAFTLGGAAAGSAQTNGSGSASRTVTVGLAAGTYDVSAGYAGSALYDGSSATESFEAIQMATALTYTGALKGAPNKTVGLSAQLVDVLGRALAGELVTFQLGTQTAQATTDGNGVAATTLKLSQKNGQYTLTTSYLPTAADAGRWLPTSTSATFSLQAK
jgi:PKD repeat protein